MNLAKSMNIVKLYAIFCILALIVSCSHNTGGGGGKTPGAEETNANLSSIQISSGTLTFEVDKTTYNVEVDSDTSSITLTVDVANQNASFVINNSKVNSGEHFQVSLVTGSNNIQVVVTADDGKTTKTYTVIVTRLAAKSNNPDLSGLVLSQGALTPGFDANTTAYSAQVQNIVTSLTVTPTGAGVNSSIKINGTIVVSGAPSAEIPLAVGENTITMVITAEDAITTKTYILVVTRLVDPSIEPSVEPSHNADLANLTISQGTLAPGFQPNTVGYSVQVPFEITTITVTPTASGVSSKITVNGSTVTSGSPAQAIELGVGTNTITTVVTAEDGSTTKSYILVVTRWVELSNDANLANLTISQGTLAPGFQLNTVGYSVQVPYEITTLMVTPTAAGGVNSNITINGSIVTSGSQSQPIALGVGRNTITTVVMAQDRRITKSYILVVTRLAEPSQNANLANLTISQGTLSPGFQPNTVEYTVQVPYEISTLTVTPTADGGVNSNITVNGSTIRAIALGVGNTTITIVVTAEDMTTTKTYTLEVTRLAHLSQDSSLANLTLSSGSLWPAFSNDLIVYFAHVNFTISSITVTPQAAGVHATITVNGSPVISGIPSQPIPLSTGYNIITVILTAEDGVTQSVITILIERNNF